jgi:hypothetical protein
MPDIAETRDFELKQTPLGLTPYLGNCRTGTLLGQQNRGFSGVSQ